MLRGFSPGKQAVDFFRVSLESCGYLHKISFLRGNKRSPSELLPRVHRVVSLVKRWLLGTHPGAVSAEHLDNSWTSSPFASTGAHRVVVESCFSGLCSRP